MFREKSFSSINLYFILSLLALWIILFELVLPANNILPRPSVVLLSLGDLPQVYNFGINYLSTFTIIILSSLLSFFLIWLLRVPLVKSSLLHWIITSLERFSNYIPGVLLGIFLILWFPEFEYNDGIFALTSAFFFLIINTCKEIRGFKTEYADAVRSLGAGENFIIKEVIWKSIQPRLLKHFIGLIFYLWTILIIFEYIAGVHGLGTVIRSALQYHDLSAFFSTLLIMGFSIFVMVLMAKIVQKKYYFWEN